MARVSWDGVRRTLNDPALVTAMRSALERGVVFDTWLSGTVGERLDDDAVAILTAAVDEVVGRGGGRADGQTNGTLTGRYVSEEYERAAVHAVLISTALNIAQARAGRLSVGASLAAEAVQRIRGFVETAGLTNLFRLYNLTTTYEDLTAVRYYRRMPRADFVSGCCHRPWSDYLLTEELGVQLELGLLEVETAPSGEMLRLTRRGDVAIDRIRRILEESGEMAWRIQQQRIAQFNRLLDFDAMAANVAPELPQVTRDFLDFVGTGPQDRVLEVGCGTGRVTLDCGLAARTGKVVATDPSLGMLQQAEQKAARLGITNVTFRQARAESLPFPDASFDRTLGVSFLHFTDAPQAVKEVLRVTKPGGTVAICSALGTDELNTPLLRAWFRPFFELAGAQGIELRWEGSSPGEARRLLASAGATDVREIPISHRLVAWDGEQFPYLITQGIGMFQRVLEAVPVLERTRLLQHVQQAGREICATTSVEERTAPASFEFVRGTRPSQKSTNGWEGDNGGFSVGGL